MIASNHSDEQWQELTTSTSILVLAHAQKTLAECGPFNIVKLQILEMAVGCARINLSFSHFPLTL
jgi:hypothetical protein